MTKNAAEALGVPLQDLLAKPLQFGGGQLKFDGNVYATRWTLTCATGPRPSHLKTATWVAGSPGNGHLGPIGPIRRVDAGGSTWEGRRSKREAHLVASARSRPRSMRSRTFVRRAAVDDGLCAEIGGVCAECRVQR